jgi:hypothetical protein
VEEVDHVGARRRGPPTCSASCRQLHRRHARMARSGSPSLHALPTAPKHARNATTPGRPGPSVAGRSRSTGRRGGGAPASCARVWGGCRCSGSRRKRRRSGWRRHMNLMERWGGWWGRMVPPTARSSKQYRSGSAGSTRGRSMTCGEAWQPGSQEPRALAQHSPAANRNCSQADALVLAPPIPPPASPPTHPGMA